MLRTRGDISAIWHCRDQSNPRTASQRWRLGSTTNSRTQVNDVKFKEAVTMNSTTKERDFRGICVWRKRVDRRDWGTSLDRKTCAATPATVIVVEDMVVLFERQGRDNMGSGQVGTISEHEWHVCLVRCTAWVRSWIGLPKIFRERV